MLRDSEDYAEAKSKGFDGEYPGFPCGSDHPGVLAAFMRRLPPRHRADFDQFLEAIRVRPGTDVSDFALLGYAGARLPGDDFSIIHPFDGAKPPFEFLLLIAGYRYCQELVPRDRLTPGTPAEFELEPDNPHDPQAVRIVFPEVTSQTAGYVCRGLLPQFRKWLAAGLPISGRFERLNGTPECPLAYLFVEVRTATPSWRGNESARTAPR